MTAEPVPNVPDLAVLTARVAELEAWRAQVDEELEAELAESVTADPQILDPDDELLDAERLVAWVHRHVAAVIARPLRGELHWCPQWWEHPEAVFRFEALRRAWTQLAPEPGAGMSIWIRDHLDPCLRELLSPLGPFVDCTHNERFRSIREHQPLPTLPIATPDG